MDEFLIFLKSWGALIISAISLVIAFISLIKASKAQKLQNQVNQLELKIKQYELEKIDSEKAEANQSCVEARIIRISHNSWKLKVWNSGNTKVYNVSAVLPKEANIIIVNSKMPFEELERNKSFEENILVYSGSANKVKITTIWEDKSGQHYEKTQIVGV